MVLGIGRLVEQKDFATVITAFAALADRCAARLMFLGEGPLRPALTTLARSFVLGKERFQIPRVVSKPYGYLARAAVFVLSSRRESLPNVLIEALACGVAVVSADCRSGPREILEDGRWEGLVPVGNREALAQAIADVLRTPRAALPDVRQRARLRSGGGDRRVSRCARCANADHLEARRARHILRLGARAAVGLRVRQSHLRRGGDA